MQAVEKLLNFSKNESCQKNFYVVKQCTHKLHSSYTFRLGIFIIFWGSTKYETVPKSHNYVKLNVCSAISLNLWFRMVKNSKNSKKNSKIYIYFNLVLNIK